MARFVNWRDVKFGGMLPAGRDGLRDAAHRRQAGRLRLFYLQGILRTLVLCRQLGTETLDRVQRIFAIVTVFLVIREVFTRAHLGDPLVIVLIPFDGLADTLFQRNRRFPAQFGATFRGRSDDHDQGGR
jgi:hypothetical protein